jgi:hypothetical protein
MQVVEEFPKVSFRFKVSSGGRERQSRILDYRDTLNVVLRLKTFGTLLPNMPCEVASPWGRREIPSDGDARVVCDQLPPGGCRLLFKAGRFAS